MGNMDGKYTVNEVEERSNVPASTLRQWERRYGFPKPERSASGYRLYSERDLEQISTMKQHIEDGVPASRAAELVKRTRVAPQGIRSLGKLQNELFAALEALDDVHADQILSEAHALHPVETIMFSVIQPTMTMIGQRWHDGLLDISTEHFASNYIHGRLRALFNLSANVPGARKIVVACAPGDQHELGALVLAIMLRRNAYRVYYLGANTPLSDLNDMAQRVEAAAVMISASAPHIAQTLEAEQDYLKKMSLPIIFGGNLFEQMPELATQLGGHFLGNDITEVIGQLNQMLERVTS